MTKKDWLANPEITFLQEMYCQQKGKAAHERGAAVNDCPFVSKCVLNCIFRMPCSLFIYKHNTVSRNSAVWLSKRVKLTAFCTNLFLLIDIFFLWNAIHSQKSKLSTSGKKKKVYTKQSSAFLCPVLSGT